MVITGATDGVCRYVGRCDGSKNKHNSDTTRPPRIRE